MDINQYREFLLSSIPTAKLASGGSFINCRCFNCPDSADPRSKHFYIAIPKSPDEPSWYYCHKCHCTGLVTHKTLIEWGIYIPNLIYNNLDVNIEILQDGSRKYIFDSDLKRYRKVFDLLEEFYNV